MCRDRMKKKKQTKVLPRCVDAEKHYFLESSTFTFDSIVNSLHLMSHCRVRVYARDLHIV